MTVPTGAREWSRHCSHRATVCRATSFRAHAVTVPHQAVADPMYHLEILLDSDSQAAIGQAHVTKFCLISFYISIILEI